MAPEIKEPKVDQDVPKTRDPLLFVRNTIERLKIIRETAKKIGDLLTPDQVTSLRIPGAIAAIGIHTISGLWGALAYGLNMSLDWLDGIVARARPDRCTKIGKSWDAFVDKATNGPTLFYVAAQINDMSLWVATAATLTVDFLNQIQRGPLLEQAKEGMVATFTPSKAERPNPEENITKVQANTFGKVKLFLQSAAIGTLLAAGQNETAQNISVITLGVSSAIGSIGLFKRMLAGKTQE